MWKCEQCGEEIEDQFDSCWNCTRQAEPPSGEGKPRLPLECLRCEASMEYEGSRHFHEGAWTDLTLHREHVDVYICPQCGHMELFAAGIGLDYVRPEQWLAD